MHEVLTETAEHLQKGHIMRIKYCAVFNAVPLDDGLISLVIGEPLSQEAMNVEGIKRNRLYCHIHKDRCIYHGIHYHISSREKRPDREQILTLRPITGEEKKLVQLILKYTSRAEFGSQKECDKARRRARFYYRKLEQLRKESLKEKGGGHDPRN